MSDTHATAMEDDTAHSGNTYVEAGISDQAGAWWAVMFVFQEHPVTEGQTYQISAWFRDGDANGAPSLIAGGGGITFEWRDAAPEGDPDTDDRGDQIGAAPAGDSTAGRHIHGRDNSRHDAGDHHQYNRHHRILLSILRNILDQYRYLKQYLLQMNKIHHQSPRNNQ